MSIQAHKCAAAQWLARIAGWERTQFWKTLFCGPAHKLLDAPGIHAPKISYHDADEGLIWIEDLGERDLFSYRGESWLVRRAFYESALDEVAKLHRVSEMDSRAIRGDLPAEFNAALYLWEQSYFFENCLGRHFEIDNVKLAALAALPVLREVAERLA